MTLAYQLKVQKEAFYSSESPTEDRGPFAVREPASIREPAFMAVPMIVLAIGCMALSFLTLTGLERPFLVGPAMEVLMRGVHIW